ncbi:PREDICTED: 5'-3' exoribonuclease 2 homolog [Ceratosolen solmsi marchali]|uniref:5'-3' exoribonuclease n=1 Tax=Ceratosolen solmsi marchali TaxID=326594 RepID=A0AAJ6YWQ1_9HYME|nr:PREDICTED: 5'-3' exoribonuclease 2 homolog [Ceratosolen solmsi marchali]
MGVPAFFRWLSRKYPSVIIECIEQKPITIGKDSIPVNSTEPNPNGVEFDNLYLDMNGIIHPCTHPEDKPAPKTEDDMMEAIFECIDRLFRIVRPRKLLYMAIDGVAPRAKMNQQRSRRFRASKETREKLIEVDRIRSELILKGINIPPTKLTEEHFDSNCITPGTPFMARLSLCLHYYIHLRLNNDPGWKNIKVILSDANVPGEGEHKIMDYIRRQRAQPDHDPNTQHVLCGADADLIMLGLATHEPNFTIIREEFKPNKPKPCDICGQMNHDMKDCQGLASTLEDNKIFGSECQFIFVRLNVLREYLERELEMPNLPFKYDFERALDDWVFMCFFVGNDFLPHLPSLEIRENAIDRLVNLYKKTIYKTKGFLTNSGDVCLDRVQLILSDLGKVEDEIFKKRQQNELAFKARERNKNRRNEIISNYKPNWTPVGQFAPNHLGKQIKPIVNARYEAYQMRMHGRNYNTSAEEHTSQGTNSTLAVDKKVSKDGSSENQESSANNIMKNEEESDEVRLWEDGFKDRYYESKFNVLPDNLAFRNNVALQYVRGLCWVLRYYYQGCASWKWYFPYHYAPFASDFINISGLSTEFEKGTAPFRPLEQLMSVFPAASCNHVPSSWQKLMKDPKSTIIDFYPIDFKIDLNGKKFAWQGIALLPFVEEERLFKALEPYYNLLSEEEKLRNIRGNDELYIGPDNKEYDFLKNLYRDKIDYDAEIEISIDGMRGTILLSENCISEGATLPSPINTIPVRNNKIICVKFKDPKFGSDYIFSAKRLEGAEEPPRVLKPQDFDQMNHGNNQWRPQTGFVPSNKVAFLDDPGHRMLRHHVYNPRNRSPGVYGRVPPPSSVQQMSQIPQGEYPSNYQKNLRNHSGYQSNQLRFNSYPQPGPWADGYMQHHVMQQSSHQSSYNNYMMQQRQQHLIESYQNQYPSPNRNFNLQSQQNYGYNNYQGDNNWRHQ